MIALTAAGTSLLNIKFLSCADLPLKAVIVACYAYPVLGIGDQMTSIAAGQVRPEADRFGVLREIERRVLWLSTAIVHEANRVRPNPSGLKVGGHQTSSASMVSI